MTIKEINELRKANEKINTEEQKIYKKELERLNEEEIKTKKDLKKKIKSHFKGIIPHILFDNRGLNIDFGNKNLLTLQYNEFKFESITKKLALTIVSEYEKVYGEIEELTNDYADYSTSCTNLISAFDDCTFYSPTYTYTK